MMDGEATPRKRTAYSGFERYSWPDTEAPAESHPAYYGVEMHDGKGINLETGIRQCMLIGMAKPSPRDKEIRRQAKLKRQKAKAARRTTGSAATDVVILTGRAKERVFGKQKVSELLLDYARPITEKLPDDPPADWFRELLQRVADTWNLGMNFPPSKDLADYEHRCKQLATEFSRLLSIEDEEAFEMVAFLLKRRIDSYKDKPLLFGPVEVVDEPDELRVLASAALIDE